jgi:asparagine synthase (glutamine-hydrolysing)
MCGIFGLLNNNQKPIDKLRIRDSVLQMKHRGPDAIGQWGINNLVELAHVRLSIIDLNPISNQPFISACGNYVIVFNGEIYNYLELKDELIEEGVIFITSSDTEVLLYSYIKWGDACVKKFNGDWAFAIYDICKKRLFCSRDRFGVKPFNYFLLDGCFVFSSEIKSIITYFPQLRRPNYNVINNYCRNGLGAQNEETWFDGIMRLKPAHNLIYQNGKIVISRYWNYPVATIPKITLEVAKEEYHRLFMSSIQLRMRSDVTVGTTLSSGVDSGSIVSVLREFNCDNHKTYTAVFNKDYFNISEKKVYRVENLFDEVTLVRKLADQISLDANFIDCNNINFVDELSFAIYHLESGHSSPAVLPLTKVMDRASKDVKVVLEGQGADELLSGYIVNTFPILIFELLKKFRLKQIVKEIREFSKLYSVKFTLKQFIRLQNFTFAEKIYHYKLGISKVFLGPMQNRYKRINDIPYYKLSFSQKFNEVLYKSHIGGLVNLLHYGDAISMSKSIESRLPFLDYRLVEYVFKLPFEFKMYDGIGKVIHRKALDRIVPDFILHNPLKFGFNTPIYQYFTSFNSEAVELLLSETTLSRGFYNELQLKKIIQLQIDQKYDYATFLYRLLSVEIWFRLFIDKNTTQEL